MPLRARRRRVRALVALIVLIAIAALLWLVSYVSYLPRFQVGSIAVVGAQNVPSRLVQAYTETLVHDGVRHFLSQDNIFLMNAKVLGREIVGYFPRIKSAQVDRESMLATALTITVVERTPFALWCSDANDCYTMDESGFIFASAIASSTEQYVFKGSMSISSSSNPIGHSFALAHLPGILALLQILSQAGFTPQGATLVNDQDFWVPLKNGFYIKASFGEDAGALVRNLQLILSSDAIQGREDQVEYVDLRFGNRVYYKLKGGSETKASQ